MSVNYVKFQRGTLTAYEALKASGKLDKNTLYFITVENGVGRLYMGDSAISGGDIILQSAKLDDLEDVVAAGAKTNSFLVYNGSKWNATSLEEVIQLIVKDSISYNFAENQFDVDEDGLVSLIGFNEAEVGTQLVKKSDGSLGWVLPEEVSLEGLVTSEELTAALANKADSSIVENLTNAIKEKADVQTVSDLAVQVANKADASAVDSLIGQIENDLDLKANIADVEASLDLKANIADIYGKEDVDQAIAEAIANVNHLKREIFKSLDDAEQAMKDYGDKAGQYIYMIANGRGEDGNHYDEYIAFKLSEDSSMWLLERVGDWSVDLSEYAKINDVNIELSKKVDKVEGARLITDVEVQKLSRVEDGAQINYISAVDVEFVVNEGKLSLNSIDSSKVNGLQNVLAEKVDKVYYTIENEDGTTSKVEGTLLSPIDKIKLDALVIDEDGDIGISGTVNASKVEGLGEWITENSAIYISNLTENNLSAAIVEKINFITSIDTNTFSIEEGKLELVNVPAQALHSTVGDLTKIQNYIVGNTLVDEINSIYNILTWTEMV